MLTQSVAFSTPSAVKLFPNQRVVNASSQRICCMQVSSGTKEKSTKLVSGLSDVIDSYKCLFLDQFGVIHNGKHPYPDALSALQNAHDRGVKIVILSNSSRPRGHTLRKMERMGIPTSCVDAVVTSGDLALTAVSAFGTANPDARAMHFNWGGSARRGVSLTEHSIHNVVPFASSVDGGPALPRAGDVDVIIAHGTDGLTRDDGSVADIPLEISRQLVRAVASERPEVPFFCANPDIVTVDGTELKSMPGTLAREYVDAGGREVRLLGKPSAVAYEEALRLAGVQKDDVLAVGDSMAHDIFGAVSAGIASL